MVKQATSPRDNHPPYPSVLDVLVEEDVLIKNLNDLSYLALNTSRMRHASQRVFKDYILSPDVYPLTLHLDQ